MYVAAQLEGVSRSKAQDIILSGTVLVNGATGRPSTRLRVGDVVTLPARAQSAPATELVPEDIPLDIVYEDADLLVLDKPAGMVVHPATGHATGTLVHALLARYPELRKAGGERPGIVHRLDKDTSGLMLVARHDRSRQYLQDELRERRVLKEYTLLCCGTLRPAAGKIEGRIGRDPRNPLRMAIVSTGRYALTEYRTLVGGEAHTLVLARLHTGRTHQLRAHFGSVGHPLAGDATYGGCAAPGLDRQFLHSSRLALRLPAGESAEWSSPLPPDLERTLSLLDLNEPGT